MSVADVDALHTTLTGYVVTCVWGFYIDHDAGVICWFIPFH